MVDENPISTQDIPTGGDTENGGEPAREVESEPGVASTSNPTGTIVSHSLYQAAGSLEPLRGMILEVISDHSTDSEETVASRSQTENLLLHITELEALFSTDPQNIEDQQNRSVLLHKLNDIEGRLQLMDEDQEQQNHADYSQGNEVLFDILEDLREAIFDYQTALRTIILEEEYRLMDPSEALILINFPYAEEVEYWHGGRKGCLRGTCRGILDEIELWARNPAESSIYWLNGLAGTGKSTIAQTIAERLYAYGYLGASFFFSRDFEDRSDPRLLFPTLAVQLAGRYPKFRSYVVPLVRSDPEVTSGSLVNQMNKLIVQPLMTSGIPTVIVIDALDECGDGELASEILSILGQFAPQIPDVKFFITGRPEPRILEGFRLPPLQPITNVTVLREERIGKHSSDSRVHIGRHQQNRRSVPGGTWRYPEDSSPMVFVSDVVPVWENVYCPYDDPYDEMIPQIPQAPHQVVVTPEHLTHQNVIPLLGGVTVDPPRPISSWTPGRDLPTYLKNHPDANMLSLLADVANGLNSLHSCDMIHGYLSGQNVFVDGTGHARITDSDLSLTREASAERDQSARWIAPEALGGWGPHSKEADVFSFAGVAIEVFTGAFPFHDRSPGAAVSAIVEGERPPRPTHPGLTDDLWALIQRCWNAEPHLRPHTLRIQCASGTPAWKRLIDHRHPPTFDERISLITDIFSNRDEIEVVESLHGNDAQSFVNAVDQMLDSLKQRLRKKSLSTLCKICGRQALLPRSLQIPLCYDRSGEALCSGGFADVWMGEYRGLKVAVKVLRLFSTSDIGKITSRFCKEVMTWKSLRHPNILRLLGVTMGNRHFAMASEWMVNGNINQFVKAKWDANRFDLLGDVARGIIYMHSQGMVHGDLKGANIVIDEDEHARLADFGLLTFALDSINTVTSSSVTGAGTTRWMSPELLYPEKFGSKKGRPTKQSDCYALGMVVLEVLSGELPFKGDHNIVVMRKVIDGERPERPELAWFTDDLWRTLEQCWSPEPDERPTAKVVLECLVRVSKIWKPLPPTSGGAGADSEETDADSDEVDADGDEAIPTTSSHPPTPSESANSSPIVPPRSLVSLTPQQSSISPQPSGESNEDPAVIPPPGPV